MSAKKPRKPRDFYVKQNLTMSVDEWEIRIDPFQMEALLTPAEARRAAKWLIAAADWHSPRAQKAKGRKS